MGNWRTVLAILIGIIAVLAIAAGIYYLAVPAHSLPSWVPGHVSGKSTKAHWKRGVAGIVAGVVLLIVAIAINVSGRRTRRWN